MFGVVRVTAAFTPLLDASSCPVVVNVSSTLGSLKECGPGGPYENFGRSYQAYGSSKSAVNSKFLPDGRLVRCSLTHVS